MAKSTPLHLSTRSFTYEVYFPGLADRLPRRWVAFWYRHVRSRPGPDVQPQVNLSFRNRDSPDLREVMALCGGQMNRLSCKGHTRKRRRPDGQYAYATIWPVACCPVRECPEAAALGLVPELTGEKQAVRRDRRWRGSMAYVFYPRGVFRQCRGDGVARRTVAQATLCNGPLHARDDASAHCTQRGAGPRTGRPAGRSPDPRESDRPDSRRPAPSRRSDSRRCASGRRSRKSPPELRWRRRARWRCSAQRAA